MNGVSAVQIAHGARAAEAWLLAELGELCEEAREDRQDYRDSAREDRQGYADDVRGEYQEHEEWYEDRWKRAVGASLTVSAFRSLQCASSTVVVNGVSYYNCGSSWFGWRWIICHR